MDGLFMKNWTVGTEIKIFSKIQMNSDSLMNLRQNNDKVIYNLLALLASFKSGR